MSLVLEDLADVGSRESRGRLSGLRATTKILVSGAVRGQFGSLFAAVAKANKKSGPFSAVLCVGDFFGEEKASSDVIDAEAPVPTYFTSSSSSSSKGVGVPRGCLALGRSGVETIGGLRVAYLSGTSYSQSDVENLSLSCGAFVTGGGVDVLLTDEAGEGYDALLTEKPGFRLQSSKILGEALADITCQYHFVPGEGDWTFQSYRAGKGAPRVARLVAIPARGKPRSLRAFNLKAFDGMPIDIDTDEGLRRATELSAALREATDNPYLATHRPDTLPKHLPPPGIRGEANIEPLRLGGTMPTLELTEKINDDDKNSKFQGSLFESAAARDQTTTKKDAEQSKLLPFAGTGWVREKQQEEEGSDDRTKNYIGGHDRPQFSHPKKYNKRQRADS